MEVKPDPENKQPNSAESSTVNQPSSESQGANGATPASPADGQQTSVSSAENQQSSPSVTEQQIVQRVQPAVTPQPVNIGGASAVGQPAVSGENPEKNYLLALAFSYLLGSLGIDRFYLGYTVTGILKLITLGGFGIWHFIDLLLIAFGKLKEKNNSAPLESYGKYYKTMKPIAIILLVVEAVVIGGAIVFIILSAVFGLAESNNSSNSNTQLYRQPITRQTLYNN